MNNLRYCIVVLLLSSCHIKDPNSVPQHLSLHVHFEQSFASPITLHLQKKGDTSLAILKLYTLTTYPKFIKQDTVVLNEEDLQDFFIKMDGTSLLNMPSHRSAIGVADGRIIKVCANLDNQANRFEFDYPEKEKSTSYFRLLDAVFNLLNKRFYKYEEYIEQNQRLFDFGMAAKVRGDQPKLLRLYGYCDSAALENFLQTFPVQEPLIADISNLPTIHLNKKQLLSFEKAHPNMIWVVGYPVEYLPGEAYDYIETLKEAGFDTTRMVRDTIVALKRFYR